MDARGGKVINVVMIGVLALLITVSVLVRMVSGDVHEVGETVELVFTLTDGTTGLAVTGESPTVALFRHADGFYLDWDDDTFKTSGWVQQFLTMGEIGVTGRYEATFDSTGQAVGGYAALVDNTGPNAAAATVSVHLRPAKPTLGTGQTPVNHDFPTTDAQIAEESLGGARIEDVTLRIFTQADYNAGRVGAVYVKALTMTDVNGEWEDFVWLDAGDFITVFSKPGRQTATVLFTVP